MATGRPLLWNAPVHIFRKVRPVVCVCVHIAACKYERLLMDLTIIGRVRSFVTHASS